MDPRLLVVVAGIAGAAALQGRVGEGNAARRQNDFRYTPDARVMRVVSMGSRSVLADVLWLRVLPDMGRPFQDVLLKKRWLRGATEAITDLEPGFGTVYSYGAAYLSIIEGRKEGGDAAIALLEKGVRLNPKSAGLHVELALAYWQLRRDRAKTVEHLEAAAALPGVDSVSLAMLASLRVGDRDDLLALGHWAKLKEDGATAAIRIVATVEYERTRAAIARRAVKDFAKARGRLPADAGELRDPSLMDPLVHDVVLDALTLDAKGRIASPRLVEAEARNAERVANDWIRSFREQQGRFPTREEFDSAWGKLPPAPPGTHWDVREGAVTLRAD